MTGYGSLSVELCYLTNYCYFTAIVMWSSVYHPVREILIFLAAFFLFDSAQVSWMVIKGKYLSDLISHRSISLVSHLPVSSLVYSCVLVMPSRSKVNSHKHFADMDSKGIAHSQLLQNSLWRQQWCTNKRPALFLLFGTAGLVQALWSTGTVSLESWTARETEVSCSKTASPQTLSPCATLPSRTDCYKSQNKNKELDKLKNGA